MAGCSCFEVVTTAKIAGCMYLEFENDRKTKELKTFFCSHLAKFLTGSASQKLNGSPDCYANGKLIKGTHNWIYTVLLHALIEQTFLDNVALVFTFLVHKTMVTVGMHPWGVLKMLKMHVKMFCA